MYIKQTYSTSTLLREQYSDALPHLYTIRTDYQTAGRGQAGNHWESEAGKNLLFSTLLRYPHLRSDEQWRLSMLTAITMREVLAACLAASTPLGSQQALTIKWPNDIYYGDKKLVGILLENTLIGQHIGYSIVGIGVNMNQTQWRTDAPNPISMKQITGEEFDVAALLEAWIEEMISWETYPTESIKNAYMQHLYRQTGWHSYMEREVSVEPTTIARLDTQESFRACIVDITPHGELILRQTNGKEKTYHFKQIRFVIDENTESLTN